MMMSLKKTGDTALIGYGRWGRILQPYIETIFHIRYIADSKFDLSIIWSDPAVTTVFIATPISTHYNIAFTALLQDKHVFIEKPIATSLQEALALKILAKSKGKHIVTDYTWMFSPTLRSLRIDDAKELILRLCRTSNNNNDVKWTLLCHVYSWLLTIGGLNTPYTIVTELNAQSNLTQIEQNGKVIWEPDEALDRHNLMRSVQYFQNVINGTTESNVDAAIQINQLLENTDGTGTSGKIH